VNFVFSKPLSVKPIEITKNLFFLDKQKKPLKDEGKNRNHVYWVGLKQ
jgi:hypothetical protein